MALFLHKDEEGRLQNRLEQWWQQIRRYNRAAISYEAAFLKVVMEMTSRTLDRVFGKRLLGPKAAAASTAFSVASVLLTFLLAVARSEGESDGKWPIEWRVGLALVVTFGLGVLTPRFRHETSKRLWLTLVIVGTFGSLFYLVEGFQTSFSRQRIVHTGAVALASCILLLAVACDFFFIAFTRRVLNWASASMSFIKIGIIAVGTVLIGVSLVLVPWGIGSWLSTGGPISNPGEQVLLFLGASNLLDALVSFAWLAVAVIMLLHRLAWPMIERPIYALYRHQVFTKQRKIVFFSGIALLTFAFPFVGALVQSVVKAVQG
jgi:hypothetical protein